MSRTQALPYDVRQECLWLIRGYERRKLAYKAARREVLGQSGAKYQTVTDPEDSGKTIRVYPPHSNLAGRTTESVAQRLEEIEYWPETQRMRAVEKARAGIGADLPENQRGELVRAIMINCSDGRSYPYERLYLSGIGRRDFYRRRTDFIVAVAKNMGLI